MQKDNNQYTTAKKKRKVWWQSNIWVLQLDPEVYEQYKKICYFANERHHSKF